MKSGRKVAFISSGNLGWKTLRQNWETHLPLQFDPVIRIDPEPLEPHFSIRPRSVRWGIGVRRAVQLAIKQQADFILLGSEAATFFLPNLRGIPIRAYCDGTLRQVTELYSAGNHEARVGLLSRLIKRSHRNGLEFIAMSQWAQNGISNDYGVPVNSIPICPNMVDVERFQFERTSREEQMRVLFVGGDFERKGGELVLKIAAMPEFKDVPFDIVTKKAYTAGQNVTFHTDLVPNSEALVNLYRGANVFLFPTLGDSAPLVVIEAGVTQMAVITSQVAALPELVIDGETGFCCLGLDETVSRLIEYKNDPALRTVHGKNGQMRVLAEHRPEVHVKRLAAAFGLDPLP